MNPLELKKWIQKIAVSSFCRNKRIPFSKSREWLYTDIDIKHKSGRFFKIVGVKWKNNKKTQQQLLIDQREIGILGFILNRGKKNNSILIQAKVEPGNVGLAQIAPTCQATLSNLDQVHGGDLPQFSDFFVNSTQKVLNSSLQSEQGTRFFGKRNKNMVIVVKKKFTAPPSFKWVEARLFCQALAQNYLVNTDSRSVLVTSDWQKLVGGEIFNKKDRFTEELRISYFTKEQVISTNKILSYLNEHSVHSSPVKVIHLSQINGYSKYGWKIDSKNKDGFQLIHIKVNTRKREVKNWDQPFLKSYLNTNYVLYCGRFKHILYFCFKLWSEPGLYNHVELGPHKSMTIKGKMIKSCWQSDEGGRFYKDKNKYSLVDIGQIKSFRKDAVWLSLKQVQELSMVEGIFCNEARSAISLILSMI